MRAIILAGGNGSRLKKYNFQNTGVPKPMLKIGDQPLLEITVRRLRKHGFKRITIMTHYMADIIETHFNKLGLPEVEFARSKEGLGTASPIALISDLKETFLVVNGDLLTDIDYSSLFKFHQQSGNVMTLATYFDPAEDRGGLIVKDGLVKRYVENEALQDMSTSIWVCEPGVLENIPKNKPFNLDDLINKVAEKEKVSAFKSLNLNLIDIGYDDRYERACLKFEKNKHLFT